MFIYSKILQPKRKRKGKRKNEVSDTITVLNAFWYVWAGPFCWCVWHACNKKKRKKRGRKTYQVSPYMGLILLAVQWQWSLFGLKRVVMCRNRGRDISGWCRQCRCRQWSLSRPYNSMSASVTGQARVGVCEGGKRVCVERVHKSTEPEKKKKKQGSSIQSPTKKPDLHRLRVCCPCPCPYVCCYSCDPGVWMLVVCGVCVQR